MQALPVEGHLRQTEISNNALRTNPSSTQSEIVLRVFVVFSFFLAAIAVIIGSLALMTLKGALPISWKALWKLKAISEINTYNTIGGGIVLFFLTSAGWKHQIQKENQTLLK